MQNNCTGIMIKLILLVSFAIAQAVSQNSDPDSTCRSQPTIICNCGNSDIPPITAGVSNDNPNVTGPVGLKGSKGERGQSDGTREDLAKIQTQLDKIRIENERLREENSAQQLQLQELRSSFASSIPNCADVNNTANRSSRLLFSSLEQGWTPLEICDFTGSQAELEAFLPPTSCWESSVNGRQFLRTGQEVVCDNGWLMFQRNYNNQTLDFNRNWNEYKEGFGRLEEDFWFGLENIHEVTKRRGCRLRVDLWSTSDVHSHVTYSDFYIESESDNYRLHVTGYSGATRDWLAYHNNMAFTTKDRDNDQASNNCATDGRYLSGWWYNDCAFSALNGNAAYNDDADVFWRVQYSKATMKVRCD